jgi:chromate transporter
VSEEVDEAGPGRRLWELAALFGRLGVTAFGGPAAHVALFHDEFVRRRGWLDERRFLDVVGAVNLLPGPNSTEVAMHIGHERAGWPGLLVAGTAFIVPASVIVLGLAWAYTEFGQTPQAEALLYGIGPVIIAIVAKALLALGRTAVTGGRSGPRWLLAAVAVATFGLYLAGVNELLLLAGGALTVLAAARLGRGGPRVAAFAAWLPGLAQAAAATPAVDLVRLGAVFLKVGALLYGSGYVLVAFLRTDLVERLGWLTETQLLDAVAIGQVTPGPLFSTATFIGYLLAGLPGAIVATVAIFLPAFAFVGLLSRLLPRARTSPVASALLDGVNAAAVGLMAGVALQLARVAVVDPLTAALAAAAGLVLWRTRLNSAWLIAAGAAVGLAAELLG